MRKILLSSLACASVLSAAGYKIPENSVNAVALSSAYVANAHGADASYYNPANMVFSANKGGALEIDATYIGLSKIKYKGTTTLTSPAVTIPTDTASKAESFVLPSLHYVSPAVNNLRFGLSVVTPAGLSKRWTESPASLFAREFTLQTVEVNPTVAYKFNDNLAMAFGIRGVYSSGVVKNTLYDMKGTGLDWGYNLALTYKPAENTNVALTYRSNVTLHVDGDTSRTATSINSGVKVTLPIPATVSLAASHTFDKTTVEAVVEYNVWSKYNKLDFNFDNSVNEANLGTPIPKNWKDTQTYRIGVTHNYDKVTAMAGFAYDPSPAPDSTLKYELPDANAKIFSLGGRYEVSDSINIGVAGLVSLKDNRTVSNSTLNGTFSDSRAYLVTVGMEYKF